MSNPFADLLFEKLGDAGLSARQFAIRVGIKPPRMSEIRRGIRKAPRKGLDRWIAVLKISSKKEQERFRDVAALTQCPARIQELVAELEKRSGKTIRNLTKTVKK